jgi:hypothetical protein
LTAPKAWDCKQQVVADQKYYNFDISYPLRHSVNFKVDKKDVLQLWIKKGNYVGSVFGLNQLGFLDQELVDFGIINNAANSVFPVIKIDEHGNLFFEEMKKPGLYVNGTPDFVGERPLSTLAGSYHNNWGVVAYRYCTPVAE